MSEEDVLLEIRDLKKYFPLFEKGLFRKTLVGNIRAVDGVNIKLPRGKTIGLVGESGCGKTTLSRLIMRLIEPSEGNVIYRGMDLTELKKSKMKEIRKKMQLVFQDPYGSLNPRLSVHEIISEGLKVHFHMTGKERQEKVVSLLNVVGLEDYHSVRYPHEFSGGQRQRIGIARALAVEPELLILDEPVSALDVAVQAQILNLLQEIKNEFDLSYIFVAHDLSVIYHIADIVIVMYLGKIVEYTTAEQFLRNPRHPYSEALISAIPIPRIGFERKKKIILKGDVPSPAAPPSGCRFRTRCIYAEKKCSEEEPPLVDIGNNHLVACHFPLENVETG